MRRLPLFLALCAIVVAVCGLGLAPPASALVSTGDGSWLWQNPLPQGNPLLGVTFADATHVWAVGGPGTLLKSTDAGATWTGVPTKPYFHFNAVCFADATHGWAVGSGSSLSQYYYYAPESVVVATTDGGTTWTQQSVPSTETLNGVAFAADDLHGWAVGAQGAIFATTNGGAVWSSQTSGQTDDLLDVCAVDATHVFACGASGVLVGTSDGGATWRLKASQTADSLESIDFSDANHGWFVTDTSYGSNVYATTNGGSAWAAQTSPIASGLAAVDFADASHGCIVGQSGAVEWTSSAGATWTDSSTSSATTLGLASVALRADGHGVAVGASGEIVSTTDYGATWSARTSRAASSFVQFYGADAVGSRACAVGLDDDWSNYENYGPIALISSDGGAHWTTSTPAGATDTLYGTDFVDANHGWIVGATGQIYASTNGGSSWSTQVSGETTYPLKAVSFADASHGWAVGDHGTLVATTNGGGSWTAQVATVKDTYAVRAISASTCLLGTEGQVFRTTDGGDTWDPATLTPAIDSYDDVTSLAFSDANHGWLVAGLQGVYRTTDGGATWARVAEADNWTFSIEEPTTVAFGDATHGWVAGQAGVIATTDGGTTWYEQVPGVDSSSTIAEVIASDATHAAVVGSGGLIIVTANGGGAPQDWTAPTTEADYADTYSNAPLTVTFTATDNAGGTGVKQVVYRIDNGTPVTVSGATAQAVVPAPGDHSNDGAHTVHYYAVDNAGNMEPDNTVSVTIDTVAPTGTMSINNGAASSSSRAVTINSAVSDPLSMTMQFSLDGGLSWPYSDDYAATSSVTLPGGNGTKTVVAQYSDLAGNVLQLTDTIELTGQPTISALTPAHGQAGDAITITGTGFGATQGANKVYFRDSWDVGDWEDYAATVTSWSDTAIHCTVPADLYPEDTTTVWVSVGVNATNEFTFTVDEPVLTAPEIDDVSPAHGPTGSSVTLTGVRFGSTQGTSTVRFGTTAAAVTNWSDTSITCTVPTMLAGPTTITVTTGAGVSEGWAFTVEVLVPPTISSITPGSGTIGAAVTIAGTNFGATQGTSTVTFGPAAATVTGWSDTSITVTVPKGVSGVTTLKVSTAAGVASISFRVEPKLTRLSPVSGKVGVKVTIAGTGFGAKRGTSRIKFAKTAATVVSWSATKIVVKVPKVAKGKKAVTLTTPGGKSNSKPFTVK